MSENSSSAARFLLPAIIGLVGGVIGAAGFAYSGLGNAAQDERTRAYLLANPEVLPEVFEALQAKEMQARMAPMGDDIETAYPGAVLGNPQGSVTLVEFSDYACGYCRGSVADVEKLIADNDELKVVIREYPILSAESADAARMALAAAEQGKFAAFHHAMFAAGRPSPDTIEAAAKAAGVDLEAARAAMASGRIDEELKANHAMAESLQIDGTPGWVVGDQVMVGAVGLSGLQDAIAKVSSET
ncbi:DsbA family protein [Altererythrobacter sp. CAU 1778]